jgi:hypothetical protein
MILMPNNIALRLMISTSLNFVFGSMNDMSFLTLLSLISIAVPGIAQIFMKVILKFLYLDVLMTEDWLLPLLVSENKSYFLDKKRILNATFSDDFDIDDEEEEERDHGLNEYFEDSDIGSMQMLVNIGSTLVYLGFISGSFTFYIILWIISTWFS